MAVICRARNLGLGFVFPSITMSAARRAQGMNEIKTALRGEVSGFADDPRMSQTLPAAIYTSQKIFEFEIEKIFAKTWQFIGHKNDFREPGDFVTKEIGRDSVIVLRDREGELRAFHNVCRHRAHRLVSEKRGSLKVVITCPYHSWAYGLDGGLRPNSVKSDVYGFDPSKIALVPVRVEEYGSFVFINLDDDAPTMVEHCKGYDERLRSHFRDIDRPKHHSTMVYDVDCNWKVVMDNGIDAYHLGISGPHHQVFNRMCDFKNGRQIADDVSLALIGGPGDPNNEGYSFAKKPDFWQSENFIDDLLFPAVFFLTFPYTDIIYVFDVIPVSAQTCRIEMLYYCVADELDETSLGAIRYMNEDLGPEDVDLNVGVQQGLNSRAYDAGRFMVDTAAGYDGEQLIHHFYRLWLAAFSDEDRARVLVMD
tara:strand:+ start:709 stop:1977 length:1269 start_codon:yes stop_codon:yes gene_type:complete